MTASFSEAPDFERPPPMTPQRPSPLQSPSLSALEGGGIAHGFFTRHGGVSDGIYSGLNVGVGSKDTPEHVSENRTRVAGWFGKDLDRLATLYQIHSADVVVVDTPIDGVRPQADGQVTNRPGIVLGVLTADCGPVLFADAEAGVIGAAHAGWKGAFDGVLENTISAMEKLGAERKNIVASLGPSIAQRNYEVGPEFYDRFEARNPEWTRFFKPSVKQDHHLFDLPSLTVSRLKAAGVKAENLDICTYADEERFYSYRRTTHRNEPDYGRQISAIMLREG
jgi:YfiH family protein